MMDLDWGQKYRPKTIDEVIVPKSRRNWLKNLSQKQGGLSMLFWGRAGCGKTTVAKLNKRSKQEPENDLRLDDAKP